MNTRRISVSAGLVLAAIALLTGCGANQSSSLASLTAPGGGTGLAPAGAPTLSLVSLPFDPSNYVTGVTNPFFPLTPGTVFTYRTDDGVETNTVEVTHQTKTILGVATTVVHDQVFREGSLTEDTFDWYAQDRQGNVWYFGEDTKELDHGVVLTTEGSWEAGMNGAHAGLIMLADPKVGDSYKQEDAPGVVADMGKVLSLKETATVPAGSFFPCLQTAEWTPLEPGNRSFKFYAAGIGCVLEQTPRQGGERVELISIRRP